MNNSKSNPEVKGKSQKTINGIPKIKAPKTLVFYGAKDFDKKLHILPFNRKYGVRKDLKVSMNIYGYTPTMPIDIIITDIFDGIERMYIADGQHRAATAAWLNIPFFGVVSHTFKTKKDIVFYISRLNTGQKPWVAYDYVFAFASLGMEDYETLLKMTNQSIFTVSVMARMLGGESNSKGSVTTDAIKAGTFKIKELEETKETLKLVARVEGHAKVTGRMVNSMHIVMRSPKWDKQKFVRKYKANAEMLNNNNLDDYKATFLNWLNEE